MMGEQILLFYEKYFAYLLVYVVYELQIHILHYTVYMTDNVEPKLRTIT